MSTTAPIDRTDPAYVVELMDLTAAELERRAERMLKLSRDLLAQSAHHATLSELPQERSLAAGGQVVTEVEAIAAAKELGNFTRAQFAAKLGLSTSGVSRWLAKLLNREHPIISRSQGSGEVHYAYIDPAPVAELRAERRPATRHERAKRIGARMGAGGLEGTGAQMAGIHKDLQPVVREALALGWKLSKPRLNGDGHRRLTRDDEVIKVPSTPRNAGNAAIQIRQKLQSPTNAVKQAARRGKVNIR